MWLLWFEAEIVLKRSNCRCFCCATNQRLYLMLDAFCHLQDWFALNLCEVNRELCCLNILLINRFIDFLRATNYIHRRTQLLVQETPILHIDCASSQIFMLEQHPNSHLPFIVCVTDIVEVVIKDLRKIMILNLFQLLQYFLEFLFALIVSYHDSQFTSYHLREEFSAKLDHLTHLFSLETPVVNEFRHGTQAPLQAKASVRGQDELEDLHLSFFNTDLPVRYGTQADTVSHLMTLSRLHVLALLE